MRSLLLSLLVRQHLALKDRFQARYPHPWLVWEAGAWNVPETERQNVAATQLPAPDLRDCLPAGDALCFELVALGEAQSTLPLGRASHNALVINDATVSREHLLLHPASQERWLVEARPRASPVTLSGQPLVPEKPVALVPGAQLGLGDVCLTFHDAEAFHTRIGRIAAEIAAREAARAS